jgi:hypothetical protein
MLPNGTTFQAALLELGRATPLVPLTQEHSANSSYAPSSINGPEEVPQRVSGLSALDGKNVVPAVTKGVAAPVDGLPRIGTTASGGDVQAFVSLEAEEAGHEGLGLPVISRQDVQVCCASLSATSQAAECDERSCCGAGLSHGRSH